MPKSDDIIKQIESAGYAISVQRIPPSLLGSVGSFVELHAVKVPEGEPVWMSRNADGDSDDHVKIAALVLRRWRVSLSSMSSSRAHLLWRKR